MAVEALRLGFPISSLLCNSCSLSANRRQKIPASFKSPRKTSFSSEISASLVEQQQVSFTELEIELIEGLLGLQGRGRLASNRQLRDVELVVQKLESEKGIEDPTRANLIEGNWQLIFTTRPGTASPIQRTFVGVDFFQVFQELCLTTEDPRVTNIVQFSDAIGELKVEAKATIRDGKRILFQFDRAAFSFKFFPLKIPYPVPFRLLGDKAKGWLDTTYLSKSGNIRISRGNKGTTFVLQKVLETRQRLFSAISISTDVEEVIHDLIATKTSAVKEGQEILEGEWKLVWSSQVSTKSWLDAAVNGLKGRQIIMGQGRIVNVVDIFPGVRFHANGNFMPSDDRTYAVSMDEGTMMTRILSIPVEIKGKFNLEFLYVDKKIRITRGYDQILLVHVRVDTDSS